ncbi:unnamed protein product [Acanthoscelides obtectus]|uniref:Uncharacterized protein n=1 Tax=Acanthoscelides obtectus TaxID=200917 RepID=A0A9P0K4N7_ACAOB|nr:unnamed protein product [Acanthoscelides obtectus]CAK1632551.1 hypothetical protein AOBTE_LOCUS7621 [Acanthoscelides obtectus]
MMRKEKRMMSVTAIIQGAQAQHWSRSLGGFGPPHMSLERKMFLTTNFSYTLNVKSTVLLEETQRQPMSRKSKRCSNRRGVLSFTEVTQQVLNEHELSMGSEVQKSSRLIGQCDRCHQSVSNVPSNRTRSAQNVRTEDANNPTYRFTPRRNLQVLPQRRTKSYAKAAKGDIVYLPLLPRSNFRQLRMWTWQRRSGLCSRKLVP